MLEKEPTIRGFAAFGASLRCGVGLALESISRRNLGGSTCPQCGQPLPHRFAKSAFTRKGPNQGCPDVLLPLKRLMHFAHSDQSPRAASPSATTRRGFPTPIEDVRLKPLSGNGIDQLLFVARIGRVHVAIESGFLGCGRRGKRDGGKYYDASESSIIYATQHGNRDIVRPFPIKIR